MDVTSVTMIVTSISGYVNFGVKVTNSEGLTEMNALVVSDCCTSWGQVVLFQNTKKC